MKMLRIFVVVAALAPVSAFACTTEDITAKATELSTSLQTLAAKDQKKAMEVTQRMQQIQAKQQAPGSMADACKMYDELIAEAKGK